MNAQKTPTGQEQVILITSEVYQSNAHQEPLRPMSGAARMIQVAAHTLAQVLHAQPLARMTETAAMDTTAQVRSVCPRKQMVRRAVLTTNACQVNVLMDTVVTHGATVRAKLAISRAMKARALTTRPTLTQRMIAHFALYAMVQALAPLFPKGKIH